VATLVAVLGLLVTLIFNTIAVWGQLDQAQDDARQARIEADRADEARLYTQIGVLTQLADAARSTERVINDSRLPALRCDPNYQGASDIKPADEAALREALGVYDFMAWLFNQGYMPSREALPIWAPRMIGAAQMGTILTSKEELRVDFPQLAGFYERADKRYYPPDPCPHLPSGGTR
jgi:hypothetical protein